MPKSEPRTEDNSILKECRLVLVAKWLGLRRRDIIRRHKTVSRGDFCTRRKTCVIVAAAENPGDAVWKVRLRGEGEKGSSGCEDERSPPSKTVRKSWGGGGDWFAGCWMLNKPNIYVVVKKTANVSMYFALMSPFPPFFTERSQRRGRYKSKKIKNTHLKIHTKRAHRKVNKAH